MNFRSIHKMKLTRNISPNKEVLIQRWQRQLIDRTHINFQEFLHLLRQHVCMNSQISFLLFRFLFNIYETWSFLFFFFLSYYWRRSFACSIVIQAGYSLNLNGLDLYTNWPSMLYMIFSFILSQQTFDYILFYWQDIQSHKICSNTRTIYTCF